MAELHELLAVEGDLKGEKEKAKEETLDVFTKRLSLFQGSIRTLEMFDEKRKEEEQGSIERSKLAETVNSRLNIMAQSFIRFWDAKYQKEISNQEAKADIVISGLNINNVPVTFLLSMEDELRQLKKIYESIPVLMQGIEWIKDELEGIGIYKVKHPVIKHKTEKTIQHKILVPATKEHPAQIKEWSEDKPVGRYKQEFWSGMLSSADKSEILRRIDIVTRAIKKARQRANNQEVSFDTIGKKIFDFIHDKTIKDTA